MVGSATSFSLFTSDYSGTLSEELQTELETIALKSVCSHYFEMTFVQNVDLREYASQVDAELVDLEEALMQKCQFYFAYSPDSLFRYIGRS